MDSDYYLRPEHGVSAQNPITIKCDFYDRSGPGQRDMHYDVELGVLLCGRIRRRHGETVRTYRAGDFWLCGIWEPHACEVLDAPMEMVMFHIHPPFLAGMVFAEAPQIQWLRFFTAPPAERPVCRGQRQEWLDFGKRMVAFAAGDDWQTRLGRRLLLQEFLYRLTLVHGLPEGGRSIGHQLYERLTPAFEMVHGTQGHIPVAQAAQRCHLSRRVFSDDFKRLTGISFAEFALRHRLSGAAQDLQAGELAIKTIAHRWGFQDSSHFHRHFTAHYQVAPSEYQNYASD